MRSLLFVPANRGALAGKAARSGADAVAIDLEDGTPPGEKRSARAQAVSSLRTLAATAPEMRAFVRINWPDPDMAAADVEAVLQAPLAGVVVPKLESIEELEALDAVLAGRERAIARREPVPILAGLETAAGVHAAPELLSASSRLIGAYFGAEDYAADVGARRSSDGDEVLYARSRVVLAARLAGIAALDQAVLALDSAHRFAADARRGRRLGYSGKLCIHPAQVALAHAEFTPSTADVDRSRRLLDAYEAALSKGAGVINFEGQMVDEPVARMARAVIAAAR